MSTPVSPSSLSSGSTSPLYSSSPSDAQTGTTSTSSSYNISTTASTQSANTASRVSKATKRKRDESSTSTPRKRLRKEKHIKSSPSSASTSQSCSDTDSDEERVLANKFDPDACLCNLFGLSSLPAGISCSISTTEGSQNSSEQPSCSYRSSTSPKKRLPVSQLKYFNHYLLKAFQKELYHEQKHASPEVLELIEDLESSCNDSLGAPILYTTTHQTVSSHLDWKKLQAALQLLSVKAHDQPDQRVGKERAQKATRILQIMCRRICKFKKKGYFIRSEQLTKWCGAALLRQNAQLTPTFIPPVKSCTRKFFLPPMKDREQVFSNPQAFLTSRLAITLFQNRHGTRRKSRIPSPPPSPASNNEQN